jgi:hypothetical protein
MLAARITLLTTASALLLTLGACADLHGQLSSSTLRLQHSADTLAEDTANAPAASDEDYPASSTARDAHALAADARELRHAVEEGSDDRDVRVAFDRVSRSFHAVRDEVHHSDSERARDDLSSVTDAYRDVEHDLGRYTDEDHPAS